MYQPPGYPPGAYGAPPGAQSPSSWSQPAPQQQPLYPTPQHPGYPQGHPGAPPDMQTQYGQSGPGAYPPQAPYGAPQNYGQPPQQLAYAQSGYQAPMHPQPQGPAQWSWHMPTDAQVIEATKINVLPPKGGARSKNGVLFFDYPGFKDIAVGGRITRGFRILGVVQPGQSYFKRIGKHTWRGASFGDVVCSPVAGKVDFYHCDLCSAYEAALHAGLKSGQGRLSKRVLFQVVPYFFNPQTRQVAPDLEACKGEDGKLHPQILEASATLGSTITGQVAMLPVQQVFDPTFGFVFLCSKIKTGVGQMDVEYALALGPQAPLPPEFASAKPYDLDVIFAPGSPAEVQVAIAACQLQPVAPQGQQGGPPQGWGQTQAPAGPPGGWGPPQGQQPPPGPPGGWAPQGPQGAPPQGPPPQYPAPAAPGAYPPPPQYPPEYAHAPQGPPPGWVPPPPPGQYPPAQGGPPQAPYGQPPGPGQVPGQAPPGYAPYGQPSPAAYPGGPPQGWPPPGQNSVVAPPALVGAPVGPMPWMQAPNAPTKVPASPGQALKAPLVGVILPDGREHCFGHHAPAENPLCAVCPPWILGQCLAQTMPAGSPAPGYDALQTGSK